MLVVDDPREFLDTVDCLAWTQHWPVLLRYCAGPSSIYVVFVQRSTATQLSYEETHIFINLYLVVGASAS